MSVRRPLYISGARLRAILVSVARNTALGITGIGLMLLLWYLASLGLSDVRLPGPGTVFEQLLEGWYVIPSLLFVSLQEGGIRDAVLYTGQNVLIGVGIGVGIGFPLGALLGTSWVARGLIGPPLLLLTTVPILTILPFLSIWFGTAPIVQSGLVIIFTAVTVAAVTQNATEDVLRHSRDYAMTLGAGRTMIIRHIVLPATVPALIGAARVATAAGWSFATLSELLGGNKGTGSLIQTLQGQSATADIMAAILALGILAVLIDAAMAAGGRWLVRWQE